MTTLAVLKARIADDLARSDLTTNIASAIEDAIEHYKSTRFYFNEVASTGSSAVTFSTVAAQSLYTSSDSASIPLFFEIDDVFVTVGGMRRDLVRCDASELEELIDSSASSGQPSDWAWINQSIRLYPIPDIAYTITMLGAIKKAAPATDGETGNVWMTEAFELLRSHAKLLLAVHVISDTGLAQLMADAAQGAKSRLEAETSKKRALGRIKPTVF